MLSDVAIFTGGLSAKELFVPLLTCIGGWVIARYTVKSNEKIDQKQRDDSTREQIHDAQTSADEDMTRRFKILMDSYEQRIAQMTAEIRDLRLRVEVCEQRWRDRDAAAPAH